jgi:hypothetical protein
MKTMTIQRPKRALDRRIQPFGDERRRHIKGVEVPGCIDLITPSKTCAEFWWDDREVTKNGVDGSTEPALPTVPPRSTLGQRANAIRQAASLAIPVPPTPDAPKPPRPPTTIRIDQLPLETTEIDLWNLCIPHGSMVSIYIARDTRDREHPIPKGFAMITFSKESFARSAVQALEGMPWNKWVLHTEMVE